MSLSTPLLTSPQTSSDNNKPNENTTSVRASDFKNINTQNKNAKPDTESAQSSSDFVKKEVNNSFANSLALLLIISTYQSICI